MKITMWGTEYEIPLYSGTAGYVEWDNDGTSDTNGAEDRTCYDGRLLNRAMPDFGWPTEYPAKVEWRMLTPAPPIVCAYCGCRLTDNGKPNCSQCGAPKGGRDGRLD